MQNIVYVTVENKNEQQGIVGACLVLNLAGRPLEFHCTAPVRPNRTQQILYGSSLTEYVCGELIATSLLRHVKQDFLLSLTNVKEIFSIRQIADVPIVYILEDNETEIPDDESLEIQHGAQRLFVAAELKEKVIERLSAYTRRMDIAEPFVRLRLALEEIQKAA